MQALSTKCVKDIAICKTICKLENALTIRLTHFFVGARAVGEMFRLGAVVILMG